MAPKTIADNHPLFDYSATQQLCREAWQRQAIADNPWLWEMGEIEDSSGAFQYRRSAAQRQSRHHRS